MRRLSKGNPVKIPEPAAGLSDGNVNELGDAGRSPGKSYLFFLTSECLGISLTGDQAGRAAERASFGASGALLTALENPREPAIAFAADRTHNRSRSPRCTASS